MFKEKSLQFLREESTDEITHEGCLGDWTVITFPINPQRPASSSGQEGPLSHHDIEEKELQSHPVPVHRCGSSKVKVLQKVPLLRSSLAGTKDRFVFKEDILSTATVRTQPLLFGRVVV